MRSLPQTRWKILACDLESRLVVSLGRWEVWRMLSSGETSARVFVFIVVNLRINLPQNVRPVLGVLVSLSYLPSSHCALLRSSRQAGYSSSGQVAQRLSQQ